MITTILTSVAVFTGVILFLVIGLMIAGKKLQPAGMMTIDINDGKKTIEVEPGQTLLSALSNNDIFLPSACGGGGTCAMCKCHVNEGGGSLLPTEEGSVTKAEAKENVRLGCQVKVKSDMKIEVEDDVLEIKKFEATVVSNKNVATFIKELILKLPEGVDLNFRAGGYIQIDIPEYDIKFSDFDIEEEYRDAWDAFKLWDLTVKNPEPIFRAYSMANHPAEGNIVMLNVRIATPPPNTDFPAGISSSYIFNLKPGDKATISGPYGEFFAKETDREMCFIGGGAGMAPMRSHIFDIFDTKKTDRKVTFWYGGRSLRELFYLEDFESIKERFPNFDYTIALSEPQPEDNWEGSTGFIHSVLLDEYLSKHEDPTEIEYYLCGPPPMIAAVNNMLFEMGVEKEMIAYDEF
jgi:Na+-transporting NADH:ubiquinone oxidoreductase subunit F